MANIKYISSAIVEVVQQGPQGVKGPSGSQGPVGTITSSTDLSIPNLSASGYVSSSTLWVSGSSFFNGTTTLGNECTDSINLNGKLLSNCTNITHSLGDNLITSGPIYISGSNENPSAEYGGGSRLTFNVRVVEFYKSLGWTSAHPYLSGSHHGLELVGPYQGSFVGKAGQAIDMQVKGVGTHPTESTIHSRIYLQDDHFKVYLESGSSGETYQALRLEDLSGANQVTTLDLTRCQITANNGYISGSGFIFKSEFGWLEGIKWAKDGDVWLLNYMSTAGGDGYMYLGDSSHTHRINLLAEDYVSASSDVYIKSGSSVVIQSPNNTNYRLKVDNSGNVSATAI